MMIKILILACLSLGLFASDLTKIYKVGNGASYALKMNMGMDASVSIYYVNVTPDSLTIEMAMKGQNTFLPVVLFQQFLLKKDSSGKLQIIKSAIINDTMDKPELFDANKYSSKSLSLTDFLISDTSAWSKYKVGKEKTKTPAGTVSTTHYLKKGEQTLNMWISENAKPLLLAKLKSEGKKVAQNYELLLISLIKNIKPKINMDKAIPLTKKGKQLLQSPL